MQPYLIDLPLSGASYEVTFAIKAASGISRANALVSVDGSESTVPLASPGSSCGVLLPELCWSADVGPFNFGSEVVITANATDNGGAEGTSVLNLPVRAFHNVGNAGVVFESGQISDVFWPGGDPSADDCQCCGGPWAGTSSDGIVLDFMWTADAAFTSSSGPGKSDQDIVSAFTDGGAIGLSVEQRSYQWSAENVDDGVIFEYEYTNTSGGEIPELFVALFIDADIVGDDPFYQDDLVGYDSSQRLIYMWDSGDLCVTEGVPCPTGYIGVALLNDGSGTENPEPHTATTYLFDKSEFDAMTEGINPSLAGSVDANDHRMILTAQPFALAPGTSRTVTFALVMGGSLAELQSNTDALRQAYESQVVNVEHTVSSEIPANYALGQNYPNPFNPESTISFSLPTAANTQLTVYNLLGEEVERLVADDLQPGVHEVRWDASGLASGVYVYRLTAGGGFSSMRSMVLLK